MPETITCLVDEGVPCPDATLCEDGSVCTACDKTLCPDHSDDFTTCVNGGLHCGDCRDTCGDCRSSAFEEGRL